MKKTERAIIIGGGIAGLLAAKVLSGFYREVVILDRDTFPDQPENRPGTPQAYQSHRLTPRGGLILNRYFPGYVAELIKYGASSNEGKTTHLCNSYGTMTSVGQGDASFSRALLEWVLRRYVQDIENVRLLGLNEVIRLCASDDRSQVTGVEIRERSSGKRQQFTMNADLVMDTSGHLSKTVQWLTELGYEVPPAELLKVDLGYSTRRYRIAAELKGDLHTIRMESDPVKAAPAGVFSLIENDTAEMVIWNLEGRYPSTSPDRFEQEIRELAIPLLNKSLQGLEPIGQPRGFRVKQLSRQHFEQMQRWPSGLLVMGDTFCQLDPIYGQGMTLAAIEAEVLEACLQKQLSSPKPDFELRVLQQMQDNIETAWWINAVSDLSWKGVEHVGPEPIKGLEFAQNYFAYILKLTTEQSNFEIFGLYWLVNSLFLSPRELFNPDMFTALLAAGGSGEAKEWLEDWLKESDRPLEERLKQTIPSFDKAAFASMEELMPQS